MIKTIPSKSRHFADHGWLQTHWHFSFSDYYDANNMNWGALRVFNDDVIKGGGGFGALGFVAQAFGRAPVGGGGGFGGFGGGATPVATGDYLVTITVDGKTLTRVLRVERGGR